MKTVLSCSQMRQADAYTIKHAPISSLALMERAAIAFVRFFQEKYYQREQSIVVLCGQGNNGGDGLAIARLLRNVNYENIIVYLINFGDKQTKEYTKNLARLAKAKIKTISVLEPEELTGIDPDLIIDAMLGSGLNKPLAGKYAALAGIINKLSKPVIAVDVPSGFPCEGPIDEKYIGVKASLVVSFQRPKINFFFPESTFALERFKIVDIGLDEEFIENQPGEWKLNNAFSIKDILKPRKNFTHKGTYGHALIVAGNTTTMGAALLAAKGCLHAGAGLTTVCLPESGLIALNTSLPEVMALPRVENLAAEAFEKYTSIAIGPGLGIEGESEMIFAKVLNSKKPLVLDADALSLLGERTDLLAKLPDNTILTPHLKEFDRLFGEHQTWWARVETAKKQARERKLIIILKNQYTFICLPDGKVHINQTGNPGMASGGMGDVLTGVIVGLLAQSYSPIDAAKLAVYIHGKAGDELAKTRFTVSASQVAAQIPKETKWLIV